MFSKFLELLILELRGMVKVLHVFPYTMDFNLLWDRGQQGGVLNPPKNDQFQVFLAVWVLFPKFLGRLRGGLL